MAELVGDSLDSLTPAHREALRWFEHHAGEVGPRPWGKHRPADLGADVTLAAQRGIHVPSGWSCALSVTSTRSSSYGDGRPLSEPDGSWVFPYAAHAGGDGSGMESRWNRGLANCLRLHVPVGVMSEVGHGRYHIWGLAYVDDYQPSTSFFTLHGPVSLGDRAADWMTFSAFSAGVESDAGFLAREDGADGLPARVEAWVTKRERQQRFRAELQMAYAGRCAVTGVGVADVLQAAHILNYSGPTSQTASNGILLRADVHLLFDRYLLTVDPQCMQVRLAPSLISSHYGRFDRCQVAIPASSANRPSPEKLAVHHEVCTRAWGVAG